MSILTQTQVYELLSAIRSQSNTDGMDNPFNKLTNEDLEAMDGMTTKSKKRKRSKRKK